jgi:transposase
MTQALRIQHNTVTLYLAFEWSQRKWRLGFSDGMSKPWYCTVEAGNRLPVQEAISKAKARFKLEPGVRVLSCYEARRDGFWLHRWLLECGVQNLVVDSSSIEVKRQARRAKTDAWDVEKLLAMLIRYDHGEQRVWRVLHVPSAEEEDARRPHRELERLKEERLAHGNRIKALLMLYNMRRSTSTGGVGASGSLPWPVCCRQCCWPRLDAKMNGLR